MTSVFNHTFFSVSHKQEVSLSIKSYVRYEVYLLSSTCHTLSLSCEVYGASGA